MTLQNRFIKQLSDRPFPLHLLIVFIAGALSTLAQAPYHYIWAMFLGWSVFYLFLSIQQSNNKALLAGWCFGFGYFAAGLWWIANALLVEGNPYSWVYPLAIAGLPALLAVFYALASWLAFKLSDLRKFTGFLLLIVTFALTEWLRGHIFTGFPWNLPAYVWAEISPLTLVTSYIGIYGLSLLTILWLFLPAYLVTSLDNLRTIFLIAAFAALSLVIALFGVNIHAKTPLKIADSDISIILVQPNISQEDKWAGGKQQENQNKLINLTASGLQKAQPAESYVVAWPETAITARELENSQFRDKIKRSIQAIDKKVFLASGFLHAEQSPSGVLHYNSLAVFDENLGFEGLYSKSHLVPFGEYVPFDDWLPLPPFVQMDGFTAGQGYKTMEIANIPPFRPLICYEIIFPRESRTPQPLTNNTEWILNVTNDAWYGDSPGPYQHYTKARFRAIEQGVPVVRVANTGLSGVIDSFGANVIKTNLNEARAESVILPPALKDKTIYARWGDSGFFFMIAVLGGFILISQYKIRNK